MTVERLVKELQKFHPQAVVKLHHRDSEPVLFVLAAVGDKENVWLESESDSDIGAELEARFMYAIEEQIDELDFYTDLLETGIDINMVRKYKGDSCANVMRKFCEEHGLI